MPRIRHGKPSLPAQAPSDGPRARTHRLLLDTAMRLASDGRPLSVADVAGAAGVSRATAYRYFPSRSQLVNAIVAESLGPVRSFEPKQPSGRARIQELFAEMFPRFRDFEPQLRAAMQLALEHWALERAGELREEPFRRGHRAAILGRIAAPLRDSLGDAGFDRLLKALSILFGIEPYIVLKDIWGASNREVDAITRWMADALVDAALRDARRSGARRQAPARRPASRRPAVTTAAAKPASAESLVR
jgi:AcrR family transcriptional regulator